MVEKLKEQKKEPEKKSEEAKEPEKSLLERAWPKLHFEGQTPTLFFWCAGFLRGDNVFTLIDAVVVDVTKDKLKYQWEGLYKIGGEPVLVHPIIK